MLHLFCVQEKFRYSNGNLLNTFSYSNHPKPDNFLFSFQMVKGRVIRLIIGKKDIFVRLLGRFWALLYNWTIWQQRHIHHSKTGLFGYSDGYCILSSAYAQT